MLRRAGTRKGGGEQARPTQRERVATGAQALRRRDGGGIIARAAVARHRGFHDGGLRENSAS
jgi:hypothetical protein